MMRQDSMMTRLVSKLGMVISSMFVAVLVELSIVLLAISLSQRLVRTHLGECVDAHVVFCISFKIPPAKQSKR